MVLVLASPFPSWAQSTPATIRVETFIVPPLVMEQEGALTGFVIELWNEVATRLQANTSYKKASSLAEALDDLRSGRADIIVSGTFLTSERDKEFDFAYPFMEAGQVIMVRETGARAGPNPVLELLQLLVSDTTLAWFGGALLFMLLAAHVLWLLERRSKEGVVAGQKYLPGILQAMFWSGTTLLSQGEQNPRQPVARALAFIWMFVGIVFVALYTAELTANITVERIQGAINGPKDLPGKRVGTVKGSISADWLRAHNAQVVEFPQIEAMYAALLGKEVDALLLGAPPLRYYAAHEGKDRVRLVGSEFDKRDAAFVLPDGSPLRRRVNGAMVAIEEDGTYQRLYDKWFGTD